MKRKFFIKFLIALIAQSIILLPVSIFANILTVCQPTGCTYSTVEAALNAAAVSGDTIVISSNISDDCAIPNGLAKTVLITSDSTRRTWTNASGSNISISNIGSACNLTFQNINIVNTSGSTLANLTNFQSNTTFNFVNCTLSNTTSSGMIVDLQNGGYLNFDECDVVGNNLSPKGIMLESGVTGLKGLYMQNCVIRGFTNGPAIDNEPAQSSPNYTAQFYNCTFGNNKTAIYTVGYIFTRNSLFVNNTTDLNLANINSSSNAAMQTEFQYDGFQQQTTFSGQTGNVFGVLNTAVQNATTDFHLACGSGNPLVDKGTDMSSKYTYDKDYVTRPQSAAFDIGAYECPSLNLAKSSNTTWAYVGDTITYCLTYTNASSNDMTTDLWDTVPGNMMFYGCTNSCDTQAYGYNNVVHWNLTIGAGQYGTVCFYARVTDYPRP